MFENQDFEEQRHLEEDLQWQKNCDEIQQRVAPDDFADFLRQLEQIEAKLAERGLGGEGNERIRETLRNLFYEGYVAGLKATS